MLTPVTDAVALECESAGLLVVYDYEAEVVKHIGGMDLAGYRTRNPRVEEWLFLVLGQRGWGSHDEWADPEGWWSFVKEHAGAFASLWLLTEDAEQLRRFYHAAWAQS